MVHICIVETTHCEYGQFHQDFDGGYQDCIATISREVYCDSIEEITFQEIRILKGYKHEEKREFEHVYADVSSDEYESGYCIIKDDYLLDSLNSLHDHYVYSEDLKLCNINVCSVQLPVEETYNKIKQVSLQRKEEENALFWEAQIKHSTKLAEIEREERDSYYAFFKNEILSGRLWCDRPLLFGEYFPIETAISNGDAELFQYILKHVGSELFYIKTSFDRMKYERLISQGVIYRILSFTEEHADRESYNFVSNELIRVINHCMNDDQSRLDRLICINRYKLGYAKTIDNCLYKNTMFELLSLYEKKSELSYSDINNLLDLWDSILPASKELYLAFFQELKRLSIRFTKWNNHQTVLILLSYKKIISSIILQDANLLEESLKETIQLNEEYKRNELGHLQNVVPTAIFVALSKYYPKLKNLGRFFDSFRYNCVTESNLLKAISKIAVPDRIVNSFIEGIERCILIWWIKDVNKKEKFSLRNFGYSYDI